MSLGGSDSNGTTTTQNQIPAWLQDAYLGNISRAEGVANKPFQAYNMPTQGADNSFYEQGRSTIQQAQKAGQGATDQAAGVFGSVANDSPMFIDAPQIGDVMDVSPERAAAGNVAGSSLTPYLNQYQGAVIDQSNREIDRSKQMADNQNAYSATRAGAFGGSRHGIIDAENERNYAQMKQDNTNSLLQSGYGQAQGLLQGDIDRQAGMSQFNVGQLNQAQTGNADRDLNARSADASARLAALQGNQQQEVATSGLNLQGAQGLLGAGQQQQGLQLSQAQALMGAGDQIKTAQDAIYGDQYKDFLRQQEDPYQKQTLVNSAVLGISPGAVGTQSSTNNSKAKGYAT